MSVTFDQIYCVLPLPAFCQITARQILIKLLSNKNQYIHFEKIEKSQGVTGLKSRKRGYL